MKIFFKVCNFSKCVVTYRPGTCKHNPDAAGLSRLPELTNYYDREQISVDSIKSICNVMCTVVPFVECLSMTTDITDDFPPFFIPFHLAI